MMNKLEFRPIILLQPNDTTSEILHPEKAVLSAVRKNAIHLSRMDVGALCYSRRGTAGPGWGEYCGAPVDLASFDVTRISFVRNAVEYLRLKQGENKLTEWKEISRFVSWIDDQSNAYPFDDCNAMKAAYVGYTRHLLHRMSISGISGKPIRQSTASSYQVGACIAVMLATGLSKPEVQGLATKIPLRRGAEQIPKARPSSDEQARTFAALVRFVDEAHRILVKGEKFPMHLHSPNDGTYNFYSFNQESPSSEKADFSINPWLKECSEFPTWEATEAHFDLGRSSIKVANSRSAYNGARKRYESSNCDLKCPLRKELAKHAIGAGLLAFIAATGHNLTTVQYLELDTLEINPTTQGHRFSGTKGRSRGKTVRPEFSARFTPVFRKIRALREWILDGRESSLLFPRVNKHGEVEPISTSIVSDRQSGLKYTFARVFPKTTWVTPKEWRNNLSYQYVKKSGGDTELAAEKLGNTEETLRKNYIRPSAEDAALELSQFFEAVYQASIERTRTMRRIPVNIAEDNRPESAIGAGQCESIAPNNPQRAEGFTELAPAPSCRDPETCLFCKFYAVHADETDIRRLLSVRYLITAIQGQQLPNYWETKFFPMVYRIDEILAAILATDTTLEGAVVRIREDVEVSGELDPFWAIHLDTLLQVGVIS